MKGSGPERGAHHRPSLSEPSARSVGSRPSSSASQIIRSDIPGASCPSSIAPPAASRSAIDRRVAGAAYFVALERADPESPAHDKNLDPGKPVILYCASGGRSALAGKTLKDLGYDKVFNLGGFKDWTESGGAIDKA